MVMNQKWTKLFLVEVISFLWPKKACQFAVQATGDNCLLIKELCRKSLFHVARQLEVLMWCFDMTGEKCKSIKHENLRLHHDNYWILQHIFIPHWETVSSNQQLGQSLSLDLAIQDFCLFCKWILVERVRLWLYWRDLMELLTASEKTNRANLMEYFKSREIHWNHIKCWAVIAKCNTNFLINDTTIQLTNENYL